MKLSDRTFVYGKMRLWHNHADAVEYAHARHLIYGTRQRVRSELVLGIPFWRVSNAPAQVAAPVCDCYPGGFSFGSFEGPQEHCKVHGGPGQLAGRVEPCS